MATENDKANARIAADLTMKAIEHATGSAQASLAASFAYDANKTATWITSVFTTVFQAVKAANPN